MAIFVVLALFVPLHTANKKPDLQGQDVLDRLKILDPEPIEKLALQETRKLPGVADAVEVRLKKQGGGSGPEPVGAVTGMTFTGPRGKLLARVYTPKGIGPLPRSCTSTVASGGWATSTPRTLRAGRCAMRPGAWFAIKSAWMFGAGRVIAIDHLPERLRLAEAQCKAETIDFMTVKGSVYDKLQEMTAGRGPDRCIDAVGAEAHGMGSTPAVLDKVKAAVGLGTDRPTALRQAIMCCRKAGTVSVPGVYAGMLDKVPMGAFVNKGLTMKSGQTHVHRYLKPLMEKVERGEIDPSFLITHRLPLADAPRAHKTFRDKQDGCIKVVLKP
ncbi:MAG TPA: hypothetical protein VGE74_22325 [Gemmata sp.]